MTGTSPEAREATSNLIHDELADRYGYALGEDRASTLKHELLERFARPGDRVLDVGCANGLHMRVVAPLCANVVGIDINERMLALARARLAEDGIPNATVVRASATDTGLPDASFDLVYSFSTLLLVPDLDRALDEIARVLRPGGIAILDITGRRNLCQLYWRRWYRSQGHFGLHALSYAETHGELTSRGMDLVETHPLGVLHQWKYVPGVNRVVGRALASVPDVGVDERVSNLGPLSRLASRWYVVGRKRPNA